jgi:hypothetical protein
MSATTYSRWKPRSRPRLTKPRGTVQPILTESMFYHTHRDALYARAAKDLYKQVKRPFLYVEDNGGLTCILNGDSAHLPINSSSLAMLLAAAPHCCIHESDINNVNVSTILSTPGRSGRLRMTQESTSETTSDNASSKTRSEAPSDNQDSKTPNAEAEVEKDLPPATSETEATADTFPADIHASTPPTHPPSDYPLPGTPWICTPGHPLSATIQAWNRIAKHARSTSHMNAI